MTAETLGLNFLYECITLKRAKVQNKWIVFCNKYGKYLPWEKEWELCCYGSSIHFHVWCTFLIFCMWVTSVKAGMSLEWLWPMCCCRDWSLSCLSLGLTKAVILQLKRCTAIPAAVPGAPASHCQNGYNRKPDSLILLQNKNTLCNFPGELLESARKPDFVILFNNFSWETVLLEVYLCINCLSKFPVTTAIQYKPQ